MPAAAGVTPARFRALATLTLASLVLIVVTGGAVRLTGSGLGCSDWPTCEPGQLTPRSASDLHAMVEFVNRLITGVVSLAVVATVVASWRRRPARTDLRWLALGLVGGVAGQIVLGGLTVLFDLAPPLVMGHLLVSMLLLWNALVLVHRAREPEPLAPAAPAPTPPPPSLQGRRLGAVVLPVLASLVVVTGTVVTAAGPHAGDETAPRLDVAVPDVARVHAVTVWLLLAAVLLTLRALGARATSDEPLGRAGRRLLVVVVAQGALGYLQYATDVPALLVGVHLLGACAVWLATLHLALEVRAVAPGTPRRGSTDPGRSPLATPYPATR